MTTPDAWRENVELLRYYVNIVAEEDAHADATAALAALTAQMEEKEMERGGWKIREDEQGIEYERTVMVDRAEVAERAISAFQEQSDLQEIRADAAEARVEVEVELRKAAYRRIEELERERNLDGQAAADYERQATMEFKRAERYERALREHHRVGYGLAWGETCNICAALSSDEAGSDLTQDAKSV